MRFIMLTLLFISFSLTAGSNLGIWGTKCDTKGFLITLSEDPVPLVINENQIIISVRASGVNKNKVDIFYHDTVDLGLGGMNLNWDDFSATKKIAEMEFSGADGFLKWKGFFDTRSKKYVWVNEPDFVRFHSEKGIIKMHRCG